nr:5-formyltetrahydrofolate cyclo-ligase [Maritimibacter dapengensis]
MTQRKKDARAAAFARRARAHGTGLDRAAQNRLRDWLAPYRGKSLSGFLPIRTEIDPVPIMSELARHGPVCVPITGKIGEPLRFARWTPGCDMIEGKFGTLSPATPDWVVPEVLIVPLLAFDSEGNRLGYGGGFYDRTLEALRAQRPTLAVGYAYDAQRVDSLPLEATDQPLDAIVTETRTYTFPKPA